MMRRIAFLATLLALDCSMALGQAGFESTLSMRDKIGSSCLTWTFKDELFPEPISRTKADKYGEKVYQDAIAQGMSPESAKREVKYAMDAAGSSGTKTWTGTKILSVANDLVEETQQFASYLPATGSVRHIDGRTECATKGEVGTAFFYPLSASDGKVSLTEAGQNPFEQTGGTALEPVVLGFQSPRAFLGASKVQVAGESATAEKPLHTGKGDFIETISLDLKSGVVMSASLLRADNRRAIYSYTVAKTELHQGFRVPSDAQFTLFKSTGKPFETIHYTLNTAHLNQEVTPDEQAHIGPVGAWVRDTRLGKGKERRYRLGENLPSVADLEAGVGNPAPDRDSSASTLPPYRVYSAAAWIALAILGLVRWLALRSKTPRS